MSDQLIILTAKYMIEHLNQGRWGGGAEDQGGVSENGCGQVRNVS